MDLDLLATYMALAFSVLVTFERVYSKAKDKTAAEIEKMKTSVQELNQDKERMIGANVLGRLVDLEQRQRNDETTLARVEQRLENVNNLLNTVSSQIQVMDRGGS